MTRTLLPVIAVAILITALGCGKSSDKNLTPWDAALSQLDQYQFDQAKAAFDKIAADRPNEPIGLFADALITERKLMFWNAMPDYMRIVEDQQTFEPARRGLWRTLSWTGHHPEAVRSASEWLAAFPGSVDATVALTQSLLDNGEAARARAYIDSAVALGLNPAIASMMRACSFHAEHQFDTANAFAVIQSALPADDPVWYRWAANYQEAIMNYDSALVLSTMAWERADGKWFEWWYHLHRLLRLDGRQAVRATIAKYEADETIPAYITAWTKMQYLTAIGEYQAAKREAVMYKKDLPQNVSTLHTEMLATRNAGDQLSAEGNAKVIEGLMKTGDQPQEYKDLLQYESLYMLRDTRPTLDFLGKFDELPDQFKDRRELQLSQLTGLTSSGQAEKFNELLDEYSKDHGSEAAWLAGVADIMAAEHTKMYDQAYDKYLDALEADRWYYPALERCVTMLLRRDKPNEAAKLFELYPYFLDTLPQAAVLKAQAMAYTGNADESITLLKDHIEPIRGTIENYRRVDSALVLNLAFDARAALVELMTGIAPDNPDVLTQAAEIAADNEMWDRAIGIADQATALDPSLLSPSVTKAWAMFRKGDKSEAFELFVQNAVSNRNDARNNMYYSYALATEGREADRAGNLARMAMFERGGDLKSRINLAYVYYKLGRFDLSYGEALKAARLAPMSPEAYYRLGLAQYERGQGEAIEHLEKSIQLGLRGGDLENAKRIIGK